MHEFNQYVSEIVDNLRISRKQKDEFTEEFNDHLYMLKKEFIEDGMAEEEAVKKAMKVFGDSLTLKKRLLQSTSNYRTIYNSLLGILLFIFPIMTFRIGAFHPVPGYNPITKMNYSLFIVYTDLLCITFVFLFVPVGYFLPILFSKINQIKHIILVSFPLSLALGIILSTRFACMQTSISFYSLIGLIVTLCGLLGSILGFMFLLLFNKIVHTLRYS